MEEVVAGKAREETAVNEFTFAFGIAVGIVAEIGMAELGWPGWVPAIAFAVLLVASWLGKDYLDARRRRKQWRIEREGSKEPS